MTPSHFDVVIRAKDEMDSALNEVRRQIAYRKLNRQTEDSKKLKFLKTIQRPFIRQIE